MDHGLISMGQFSHNVYSHAVLIYAKTCIGKMLGLFVKKLGDF